MASNKNKKALNFTAAAKKETKAPQIDLMETAPTEQGESFADFVNEAIAEPKQIIVEDEILAEETIDLMEGIAQEPQVPAIVQIKEEAVTGTDLVAQVEQVAGVISLTTKVIAKEELIKILESGIVPKVARNIGFVNRDTDFGRKEGNFSIKGGTSIRWYLDTAVECKKLGYPVIRSNKVETVAGFVDKNHSSVNRVTNRWTAEACAVPVKTNEDLKRVLMAIETLI